MKLRIQKLHPAAQAPKYATDGSACFDIRAVMDETKTIFLGESVSIRTGLAFEVPEGHVMLVYGRSGHAFKHGTRLANCVAVIDADYRGEVMVKMTRDYETDTQAMTVSHGDRIAQAMIVPIPRVEFDVCEQLTLTDRGQGGFGSTGN
jgi:dUTP pyrophosphatase